MSSTVRLLLEAKNWYCVPRIRTEFAPAALRWPARLARGRGFEGTEPIYTVEIYEGEPNAGIPQLFLRARPNEEL
jgi:hypothetical protein